MHHEVPDPLDVEWYRKRARELLRAYRAGDALALERVHDVLRQRAPIKLSDAQHVIAIEHGYASWSAFKQWLQTRTPEPPVGRIGREPLSRYEQRAQQLVDHTSDPESIRRVRHHVPRLHAFSGGSLALRDARLVVAREYGFPSWRDLLYYAQRAIDEYEHRPSGPLAEAFQLIRGGDVDGVRRMLDADPSLVRATYKGAAATMLEAIAQPDVFGEHLGVELGVDRRIVDLLIDRGSALETPLNLAACFNRAELVGILLQAGAKVADTEIWGITPLQSAVYHGAREAADLLAAVAIVPDALYLAAGSGRLDSVEKWFDSNGVLKVEALRLRPNLADVGWPPAPPPRDEPQNAIDEAFALAAFNGRIEVMARLVERGANVNGVLHQGVTGLHLAALSGRLDVARWLVAHGADLSCQDQMHHGTPLAWAAHNCPDSDTHRFLEQASGGRA